METYFERRQGDRRKAQLPFDGEDRRQGEKRSGKDRRTHERRMSAPCE